VYLLTRPRNFNPPDANQPEESADFPSEVVTEEDSDDDVEEIQEPNYEDIAAEEIRMANALETLTIQSEERGLPVHNINAADIRNIKNHPFVKYRRGSKDKEGRRILYVFVQVDRKASAIDSKAWRELRGILRWPENGLADRLGRIFDKIRQDFGQVTYELFINGSKAIEDLVKIGERPNFAAYDIRKQKDILNRANEIKNYYDRIAAIVETITKPGNSYTEHTKWWNDIGHGLLNELNNNIFEVTDCELVYLKTFQQDPTWEEGVHSLKDKFVMTWKAMKKEKFKSVFKSLKLRAYDEGECDTWDGFNMNLKYFIPTEKKPRPTEPHLHRMSIADFWLNNKLHRKYENVIYRPLRPDVVDGSSPNESDTVHWNLFEGMKFTKEQVRAYDKFLEACHIFNFIKFCWNECEAQ
jgi:hypothetical protein